VMAADAATITVLFGEVGYKTLSRSVVEEESLLEPESRSA